MNAPFKPPQVALPPIPLPILAEAALTAWARDRRAYKSGFCDEPAPYPMCWHTFEGDAAPAQAVRVTLADGSVAFVRMSDVDDARAARAALSSPAAGDAPR